jgi:hypothetical protein
VVTLGKVAAISGMEVVVAMEKVAAVSDIDVGNNPRKIGYIFIYKWLF